jgi:glycosyltransferase involved in cell wall biosynthesis
MPVHNTVAYLRSALLSISNQTFSDFELLTIDDGSTDGSTELLKSYLATEPRMRLLARPRKGLIATRNELLESASGDLIAWMDSDDLSLPDRLALQVRRFDDDPELACLGTYARCIDPYGFPLNVETYPQEHPAIVLAQANGGAMRFATTMMLRSTVSRLGGFREPFHIGEDFDFLLRLSEIGKMENLPMELYLYRQHLGSICATQGAHWLTHRDTILALARERKRFGTDRLQRGEKLVLDAAPKVVPRQAGARIYAAWASHSLRNGNTDLALKYAGAAVRAGPFALHVWRLALRVAWAWLIR